MLLIYSDICVLMNYIFHIYSFWLIQHIVNCCNFASEIILIIKWKCKMKKTLLMLFAAFCAAKTMFALTIEAGKYYTIKANSDKSTAFMADNNAADDRIEGVGRETPSIYWQFVPTGNTDCYYIKNCRTNRYIQSYPNQDEKMVKMGNTPVEYYVKSPDGIDGRFYFAVTSNSPHDFTSGTKGLNLHAESNEEDCYVQSYKAVATGNGRSQWTLSEVKLYTIANNTAASTQFVKDNGGDNPAVGSLDNASLWRLEDAGSGQFYVRNVKTGRYAQACSNDERVRVNMGDSPVAYAVVEKADGVYGLTSADHANKVFSSSDCIGWNWDIENNVVITYAAKYNDNKRSFWKFTEYQPQAIGMSGYASYGNTTEDVIILGAQAYKGKVGSSYVSLTEVSDVRAGSAVVLKGDLFATIAKTATSDMTDNDLVASTGITADGSQYCLAEKSKGVGFYLVKSGVTIPAGKAYLTVPASIKEFYGFDDDDATSMNEELRVKNEESETAIFNLVGQRVLKMQKGINIVNGKKILK